MAILTWRNVDAPNLAGAAEVIGNNGQRFAQSLNDLASGLGQFGQAQTDRADAAAIQAASRITDSGAYAQALADGSILRNAGINPNQVSAKVSQLLANRQNDLLQNDYNQAQLENQQQDNQMARDRFEFERQQAELTGNRDQYRFDREKLGNERADQQYADNQAAQQLAYTISQMGTDAAGARAALDAAGVSDKVKQLAASALRLPTGGILPSGSPGTGGALHSGADAWWGSTSGNPDLVPDRPLSQGTFGEAHDFGQRLIPATRGKVGAGPDKGTSAVGAYQMIGDTMERYASKVLGANWREQPFTFTNQSKVAEAIFNDMKDGNLQAVWAGLPDSTPGAYKNMSFEQFQREVLPRESGITLDEARNQEAEAQRLQTQARINDAVTASEAIDKGMAGNAAQRLGNIDLNQFFKDSENKDPDLTKAAERATKEYPSLKGTELNKVSRWLDTIQQQAAADGTPLTASQATHILGASMSPSGVLSFHPFAGAESGLHFDEAKMQQVLRDVNQGGNIGRSIVAEQIAADREKSNNATVALANAVKDAQAIRDRVAQGLPVEASVQKRVNDALNKALANREALNTKFSDPAYQQKLTESNAEVARKQAAAKSEVAARFTPVPTGTAQGIAYGPATAITTGLPSRAATLLDEQTRR